MLRFSLTSVIESSVNLHGTISDFGRVRAKHSSTGSLATIEPILVGVQADITADNLAETVAEAIQSRHIRMYGYVADHAV